MIDFRGTRGGFEVMFNGRFLGFLMGEQGFCLGSKTPQFAQISHEDLCELARKSEEIQRAQAVSVQAAM